MSVQKENRRIIKKIEKTREDPKGACETKGARMIVLKAPLILLRFKGGWGVPLDVGLVLPLPSLSSYLDLFSRSGIWVFLGLLCVFGVWVQRVERAPPQQASSLLTRWAPRRGACHRAGGEVSKLDAVTQDSRSRLRFARERRRGEAEQGAGYLRVRRHRACRVSERAKLAGKSTKRAPRRCHRQHRHKAFELPSWPSASASG